MRVCHVAMFLLAGVSLTAQERLGPAQNSVNYSLEKEAALGKQVAADFREQAISIDSPILQSYLDRVGRKIAASMPEAKFPFTFGVTAGGSCGIHEPTALPGGYIFVPVGLFMAAQGEDEFAGMLAHAMGHVAQRHGSRQAIPGTTPPIPVIFIEGWGGGCSGRRAIPAAFVASQRSIELEADVLAVQTLARAGFDPNGLVRYVEGMQVQPTGPTSYSPIADRDERIAALLATIQKLPKIAYAVPPLVTYAFEAHTTTPYIVSC